MSLEEFGKIINRSLLISLDRISGPRLVRVLYVVGLAVAGVWGLNHFFATFRIGFGDGLWGLLEIVTFGLFGIIALRIACEALIVYFEANKDAVKSATHPKEQTSLIDEVRGAIEELGEDPVTATPATRSVSAAKPATARAPVRKTPRTAKRTPKLKPPTKAS